MGFRTNLLKFDKNNCPENFTFILANKSLTHLGQLNNVETSSVHYVGNLNGADEISLKVYKSINGEVEPLWDNIVDFKTLYVAEVGEYFEITVSLDDEKNGYKTLTCTSLCEAELSNLNLYDIEINTEADIDRADYVITTFYNEENPKASLLHRILKDKAPHYTIKYIDNSLKKLQRSFSINSTSIYEFLTGECAEQFNCMFVFNSSDRSISVYDLYTVCNNCGYRGAYSDVCPECGSDFLNYFGNDTAIYIDKENFAENIKFEVDTGSVKNCFRLVAGDDIMTATIRSLNQNGSNYIFYFTDEMKQDMSEELVEKLYAYDVLYDSYTEEYEQLLTDYYKAVDDELYYTSTMMPEAPSDDEDTDNEISIANQEIEKLTVDNLSPIGLTSVTTTTSIATVNSAIKNYAKVFVNSGLVKVDTLDSTFVYKGKNGNGDNYGEWTGKIQLTNYSDEEDIATTTTLTLTVHDNYPDFVEQKVLKNIANNDEDHSIYDVIKIEDINEFKEALTYYSLNRLESFKTAIKSAIDILIEVNEGSEDAELYNVFYTPYVNKLEACENEMNIRQATINEIVTRKENLLDNMISIQSTLNFEAFLGDLYKEFCTYRREDEYNNSNYISDGLDDSQRIANARDFIDAAKKELYKSATKQNTITADLYNLLAMPEFKPLVENFVLGNFIRVNVDDTIYRLRLINFEINFSDLTKLPVQFSDVTITKNGLNDVKSILDSAKNVGQNFAYVSKQAEKGQVANSTFEQMYQNGLNSALYRIKNNDNEEIIIDKGGILGRSFDDIENDYSQEQVRITHNLICFTTNNWRSVEQAIGKHNYYKFDDDGMLRQYTGYGVSAKFLTAPYINNAQFIGGDIYSTNFSSTEGSHINLLDGSCNLGHKIIYDAPSNEMILKGVTIAWDTTNSPEITDISGLKEYLNQLDGRIQTYSQDTDPSINWSTTEKNEHIGDLWFDTKNNLTKRWNGSSWDTVTDSELEKLAKSKAQIFTTTPTVPYYVGDLWVQGSSGDIMNCIKTRTSGSYSASDWTKSSKYTDDTVAKEALEAARQGISDAAAGISLADAAQKAANNAQNSANEAKESASNAQTRAENAEMSAKDYADRKDSSLSTILTNAYKDYTNSEINKFDIQVANYFGLDGGTIIGENYMISPLIAGGYLNITKTNNDARVIIDPNNLTGNNYIFQIHNGSEISIGIKADGTTNINGHINAKSLTLGSGVSVPSSKVSGLSSVATSGKYDDLTGKPTIPTSVADLGLDTSKIIYKGDITQTTKQDSNGLNYLETKVPTSNGDTITYSTYDADNYLVFGRSKGTNSDGKNYVCIDKNGLLTARNALVYGTIYATDGEFTGKVTALSGSITGDLEIGGSLYSTKNNHTVTFRGVQSNLTDSVFSIKDSDNNIPFRVNGDGSFTATKATVQGILTAGSGSIIGGTNGWEITSNQIRSRDKVISAAGVNVPRMILSTGSTVADTYMLVSDCFQLGGWQDENHTAQLGARFIGNVEIHGACKIKGATIAENMAITGGNFDIGNGVFAVDTSGNLTTKNINATGGKIGGITIGDGLNTSWKLTETPAGGGAPQENKYVFSIPSVSNQFLPAMYVSKNNENIFEVTRYGGLRSESLYLKNSNDNTYVQLTGAVLNRLLALLT